MRSFGSFLAGLLALAAFAVALPLSWVALTVADEDGYVSLSRAVLDDDQTRDAVVERVVDEVEQRATERLVELGFSEGLIDAALEQVAGFVADGLAEDVVIDAWGEAQRQAHRQMFADASAEAGFIVELAPLVEAVAASTGVEMELPGSVRIERDDATSRHLVAAVGDSPHWAVVAGLVTLLGTALSVVTAWRRGTALTVIGVGALVVAGLELAVSRLAVWASDPSASATAADLVAHGIARVAQRSFESHLAWVAVGAVALTVAGLVISAVSRSTRDGAVTGPTAPTAP